MAAKTDTSMTIRMNREIKQEAQEIFSSLGMDMTTAINVFLRQAIRFRGFPFDVRLDIPNEETLAAINEVPELKKNPNKKTYGSFAELLEELDE